MAEHGFTTEQLDDLERRLGREGKTLFHEARRAIEWLRGQVWVQSAVKDQLLEDIVARNRLPRPHPQEDKP